MASKGFKENEKGEGAENEIERKYHAYLMSDSGFRINLHSDRSINLLVGDELQLKSVIFQKKLDELKKK